MAVASRNPDVQNAAQEGMPAVSGDVTKIRSVEAAFQSVREKLGIPSVVVYNGEIPIRFPTSDVVAYIQLYGLAAALTSPSDPSNPFTISPYAFENDTAVNLCGAYTALRESVQGFKDLGNEIPKVFIATGNVLPFKPTALGITLGAGKAALTHLLDVATKAYCGDNFRYVHSSQTRRENCHVLMVESSTLHPRLPTMVDPFHIPK